MIKKLFGWAICMGAFLLIGTPATHSADEASMLIAKIYDAYGGKSLTSLTSLTVRDRYRMVQQDGGRLPGEDSISRLHSTLWVDFSSGRRAVRNWSDGPTGRRLGQILFDGETGWSINLARRTHVRRDDLNGNNVGRGMMRLLDTTVARALVDAADTAVAGAEAYVGGIKVREIKFRSRDGVDMTIFVDPARGLLFRMEVGNTRYDYRNHRKAKGLTFAADTNMMVSGKSRLLVVARQIDVNRDTSHAYQVPSNSKLLDGMRDTSRMDVVRVGEKTYMVGKNFAASVFYDAGDQWIAAGGLSGIKDRLDALNGHLGTAKTLGMLVVPEHHPGHNGGLQEAADMGATLVVAAAHKSYVQDTLTRGLGDDQFLTVEDNVLLADGGLQVAEIETSQSAHYLLFYVPAAKLAFSIDDFGTNVLNAVPPANRRTVSFRHAIEASGLDIETFVHVHGTGVLTLEGLRHSTNDFAETICPPGFAICAD